MSKSFRPVKEVWGPFSDLFLDEPDTFIDFLEDVVGDIAQLEMEQHPYGEVQSIHIPEGSQFLDFVKDHLAEYKDALVDDYGEDAGTLVGNMVNLEPEWREFLDEGELTFYVDM